MDFEITAQIDEALLPLAAALYIVGVFLKATPRIADWCIPWILLAIAMLAANVLLGWSVPAAIQGALACGIAVLGDQLYKQAKQGLHESKGKRRNKTDTR